MSSNDILATKLFIPPLRPVRVTRPRLIERLNEGLHHKLTLLSAPAGFGKTTLLGEWVAILQSASHKGNQIENRVAWISLDEEDNDLSRFLVYFIAAVNQIIENGTTIGEGALNMLQSPQPPRMDTVLTPLINELVAVPGNLILVLDDYHRIESSPVDEALAFLLEGLPPHMLLVIATRSDPQLPFARLRTRDQLTEIRAADLRFTQAEAADFLNHVMGLDLTSEEIAALDSRTEGWIAGLLLAAISMRGLQDTAGFIKSFKGSHHFVLDFLVEEVLEKQPEQLQGFLMQTSILERLSGALCDAITGQENGQETLETLENNNLFIVPLDHDRRWYRYHHLFVELLRQRLRQTQPEQVPILHTRASAWYERKGFADEAIEHALRAEDYECAASLIEDQADAVWQSGEHTKMWRWLGRLPSETVFSKSQLSILHAVNMFTSGQHDAAERSLQAAERALHLNTHRIAKPSSIDQDQMPDADSTTLQGRIAATRALLASYRGDAPGIIPQANRALEYLPEHDTAWRSLAAITLGDAYSIKGDMASAYRAQVEAIENCKVAGNIFLILYANLSLAATLRQQGLLQQAIEICQQQLQLANESGMSQTVVAGWLFAIWGEVLAELNDLDEAIDRSKRGVELTERGVDRMILCWSYLCLMRVKFSRGDIADANELVQKMENISRESDVPLWITSTIGAWQARIWLAQNDLEAASQWVEQRGLTIDDDPPYADEVEYVALARILIAQGRWEETIPILQNLLETAESHGYISRVIEILMLQALAFQDGDDLDQAMIVLGRALSIAEPSGFIRIFVDEGQPMFRLLHEALERGIATEYIHRLLGAFSSDKPETDLTTTKLEQLQLIEPLSERELEVLYHIAEGLTNREIAERLYLSLNTIKVHTRNIYGKLGVNNRTQAVARASYLGLLEIPNA